MKKENANIIVDGAENALSLSILRRGVWAGEAKNDAV